MFLSFLHKWQLTMSGMMCFHHLVGTLLIEHNSTPLPAPLMLTKVLLCNHLAIWPDRNDLEEAIVAGITVFPFWGPAEHFPVCNQQGNFLAEREAPGMPHLGAMFPPFAGPCMLSCFFKPGSQKGTEWKIPHGSSGKGQAILQDVVQCCFLLKFWHIYFFVIKNCMFSRHISRFLL